MIVHFNLSCSPLVVYIVCVKTRLVCHSEEPAGDEESCTAKTSFRARFLAEFTLSDQSEILRCAQDDSEGLGMTGCTSWCCDLKTSTEPERTEHSAPGSKQKESPPRAQSSQRAADLESL